MRKVKSESSRQKGTPVGRSFLDENRSCANTICYDRPVLLQKSTAELSALGAMGQGMPDWAGTDCVRKYKRKTLYGGASTYRGGEVFGDDQK